MLRADRGISPVIGSAIIVAMVIILTVTMSVYLYPMVKNPGNARHVVAEAEAHPDGTISLTHRAGYVFNLSEIQVMVTVNESSGKIVNLPLENQSLTAGNTTGEVAFNKSDGAVSETFTEDEWNGGETLTFQLKQNLDPSDEIVLRIIDTKNNQFAYESSVTFTSDTSDSESVTTVNSHVDSVTEGFQEIKLDAYGQLYVIEDYTVTMGCCGPGSNSVRSQLLPPGDYRFSVEGQLQYTEEMNSGSSSTKMKTASGFLLYDESNTYSASEVDSDPYSLEWYGELEGTREHTWHLISKHTWGCQSDDNYCNTELDVFASNMYLWRYRLNDGYENISSFTVEGSKETNVTVTLKAERGPEGQYPTEGYTADTVPSRDADSSETQSRVLFYAPRDGTYTLRIPWELVSHSQHVDSGEINPGKAVVEIKHTDISEYGYSRNTTLFYKELQACRDCDRAVENGTFVTNVTLEKGDKIWGIAKVKDYGAEAKYFNTYETKNGVISEYSLTDDMDVKLIGPNQTRTKRNIRLDSPSTVRNVTFTGVDPGDYTVQARTWGGSNVSVDITWVEYTEN